MPKKTKVDRIDVPTSDTVISVYQDYLHGVDVLRQSYALLGNKSPLDYWNDGRKRFNSVFGSVDRGLNDWKSGYFSQMTRNKCLGFVAHIENQTIQPSIFAQNKNQNEDRVIANFLKDTVEYTQQKEEWDDSRFWSIVTAAAEGTIVLSEQYGEFKRNGKKIKGPYTVVVPNDEFLLYDPFLIDIQEQEWVMWRRKMTIGRAKRYYGMYEAFKDVRPGKTKNWGNDIGNELRRYDALSDLADNEVEVLIRHKEGKLDIVCAGIQLTEDEKENPRADGQIPYSRTFFEPIDAHFAFGKSLPDKLSQDQDETDHLWRSYIDRQELRNFPPIQTNRLDLLNEEIIIPGNTVFAGDSEAMKVSTILPQLEQGIDSGTVNLLQALQGNASDSSMNNQQMGTGGEAGTATESAYIAKNAQIMLGMFGRMISFLVRDWTRLRCNTIIWMLKSGEIDFSQIVSTEKLLSSGKIGTRTYEGYEGLSSLRDDPENGEFPRTEKSFELLKLIEKSKGKKEKVLIDPEYLKDLDFYVYTDGEPRPKKTDLMAKAMAKEDFNIFSQRPDLFNQIAVAEDFVIARGGDPERLINKEQAQQPQAPISQPIESGISNELLSAPKKLMQ
jgi:hypothetical protein